VLVVLGVVELPPLDFELLAPVEPALVLEAAATIDWIVVGAVGADLAFGGLRAR